MNARTIASDFASRCSDLRRVPRIPALSKIYGLAVRQEKLETPLSSMRLTCPDLQESFYCGFLKTKDRTPPGPSGPLLFCTEKDLYLWFLLAASAAIFISRFAWSSRSLALAA